MSDLTVGGIWAGAGAGLLGAKMAGFKPIFNVEPRPFVTKAVMSHNFPGIKFYKEFNPVLDWKLCANLIVGSPDCKVFSNLSTKAREKNREITKDPFDNDFIRALTLTYHFLKPEFFIFENLPNILNFVNFENNKYSGQAYMYDINKPQIKTLIKDYSIQVKILNSLDFGVAQSRKRLYLIGSRIKTPEFDMPNITSNRTYTGLEIMRYGETVGEALQGAHQQLNSELPKHSSTREEGFRRLEPGDSYYGTQNNRRLYYDRPSWTVASSCSRFVHPTEPRTLTVRETARLMGWPDGFIFKGTSGQKLDQVGKSMVPQIPFAIAEYLKSHLDG